MMEFGLLNDSEELLNQFNIGGVLPAIVILLSAWLISYMISRFLDSLGEKWVTKRLILKQIAITLRFSILLASFFWTITFIFELSEKGISLFVGLIFFAFSFSSKDLVASLMSGIILLFDRPFQVGDRISFDGVYGEVKEIGLRSVRIVDLDDNLISIPNNQFLQTKVSSANAGSLDQLCVMTFYIEKEKNHNIAMKLIREAVSSSRFLYCEKPIAIYLKEVIVGRGESKVMLQITAKAYVIDGRYESAFISDVHVRIRNASFERKITLQNSDL